MFGSRFYNNIILFFIIASANFVSGDDGYCASFNEDTESCSENEYLILALHVEYQDSCDDTGSDGKCVGLSGFVMGNETMECDVQILIEVYQQTKQGEQYTCGMKMSVEDAVKDENTPFYPILQKLEITKCPITEFSMDVPLITLSLDSMKSVLTQANCGMYTVKWEMFSGETRIVCYLFGLSISDC